MYNNVEIVTKVSIPVVPCVDQSHIPTRGLECTQAENEFRVTESGNTGQIWSIHIRKLPSSFLRSSRPEVRVMRRPCQATGVEVERM